MMNWLVVVDVFGIKLLMIFVWFFEEVKSRISGGTLIHPASQCALCAVTNFNSSQTYDDDLSDKISYTYMTKFQQCWLG